MLKCQYSGQARFAIILNFIYKMGKCVLNTYHWVNRDLIAGNKAVYNEHANSKNVTKMKIYFPSFFTHSARQQRIPL